MHTAMILIMVIPLTGALAAVIAPPQVSQWTTAGAGLSSFALVVSLVGAVGRGPLRLGFLRVDSVSMVFLLATSFLYLVTAVYCVGYFKPELRSAHFGRYGRIFGAGLNIFAWSMLCAPLMNGLALVWVAIEITTVVSALLVAIENTDNATEASWKYVLIASAGLGIALLATVFMYYAGAQQLGSSFDLSFDPLLEHAGRLGKTPVALALVLAVLGYGTKVGLVPVHTWLPDAHAEAPTPVSALLSGSLLTVSLYAVVRYVEIAGGALGPTFPRRVLLVFGLASLIVAVLSLFGQRDIKRLLAYSSIEHMGILALGISFGAPIAIFGVLLHVLAHAAAKGGAFMSAGALVHVFHTKDLATMRDAIGVAPRTAVVFLLLILGLLGFPPSGLFRSEFQIVAGGLASSRNWATVILVIGVNIAFVAIMVAGARIVFSPTPAMAGAAGAAGGQHTSAPAHEEPSSWMLLATGLCLIGLLLLGVHPPAGLVQLLTQAAAQISGSIS